MNGSNQSPRASALFGSTALVRLAGLALLGWAAALPNGAAAYAQSVPTGGSVSSGSASIATGSNSVTVSQSSQNVAINWQSFSIDKGSAVVFVQPNSTSVALNRVTGADASVILGSLTANGKVFLVNPNGILFGKGSNVNVGGLVASSLNMSDADFMAGRYTFSGTGGAVLNQGTIVADGGFVALLGANVSNEGTIQANLGTVALAAGEAITLDVAGDGLLNVAIDKGAVNALVNNGGLLRANGGQVLMTAQAAGQLLRTAVNNSGIIEARTLENRNGVIKLLGDMESGTMSVAGVLDASAPDGGDGGFIETSAATVTIADDVMVTTAAPLGRTGTWLIDPQDFTIAATGGNISGATLSKQLVTSSVVISTIVGPGAALPGEGHIHVDDAVAWTSSGPSGTATTLTLNAVGDVNINAAITATKGNLVVCCGGDVNVKAPITTTNGSVLLNAGQNVNVFHAITTTDGNIALCAGHDVHIDAKVTLTRGSTIAAQSLGLPVGLTLIAGADGTGPGAGGGTVVFAPLAPPITVTKAPVSIAYNPVSYAAPTDFSTKFVLTEGAALTQRMLLFPHADKVADGTTGAVLSGFNTTAASGEPTGVTLVAGPAASAVFDSAAAGSNIGIAYSGYSLAGANADRYALAGSCCVSTFRTSGAITAAASPPPPAPPPPAPPPPAPPPPAPPPPAPPPPAPPPPAPPPPVPPPPAPPPPTPPPPAPPPPAPPPPPVPPPPPPVVVVTPPVVTPPLVTAPPLAGPAPPPVVPPVLIASPILTPLLPAWPGGPQVAVVDGGVRMPAIEAARNDVPDEEDTAPVARPAPAAAPVKPVVPVYPRKQARH